MPVYRVPVDIVWTGPGSPGANIWHVRTVDPEIGSGQLQNHVNTIHTFYAALASNAGFTDGIFATGTTFTLGSVTDVETDEAASPTWTTVTQTTTLEDAAPVLQVCVGWKTASASRRGTGRTFLGPLNKGCVDTDGSIRGDRKTTIMNAAQAVVTANASGTAGAVAIWGCQA